MMKRILIPIFLTSFLILVNFSCGKESELGGCTVSSGGFGTGQPFRWTNHSFINEEDCRQLGEDCGKPCKASYCPPTGDDNDCYQVWP